MKLGKVLNLKWEINEVEVGKEERYCHNCGKKVIFQDSLFRRQMQMESKYTITQFINALKDTRGIKS